MTHVKTDTSLNAKIRNVYAKTCQLCQRKSVAKRLFDSVLAKNQISLNETPREIMKMGLKTELKTELKTLL